MYKSATAWILTATVSLFAQTPAKPATTWRAIGNTLIDRSLAGLATGPVDRVWYSADGSQLQIRTASGKIFATSDFETWRPSSGTPPAPASPVLSRLPEADAQTRAGTSRLYAFGKFVYASENGANWNNLTAYRNTSIIGTGLRDLAVSPVNDEEASVASASGVFRTVDGGKSWSGLNQGLPNLPSTQLLSLPSGDQGTRLALPDATVVEWEPGQKQAWLPSDNSDYVQELQLRQAIGLKDNIRITAYRKSGEMIYLGTADSQLRVSADGGKNYTQYFNLTDAGAVTRIWTDPSDPRIAIAVLDTRPANAPASAPSIHVLRTINGGAWDDITANLPDTSVRGVTADRSSGAVYVATGRGVFYTSLNLETLGSTASWTPLAGLPDAPVADVKLDEGGNQLFAAVDGYGVYSTLAPHRFNDPRVVSTADFVARAAAPGSLVSIAGAQITSGHSVEGNANVAILGSTEAGTQIQIPFDARGTTLSLAVASGDRNITLPSVPLEAAAPAIFVEPDGSPMLYDADTGVMLDAMTPARSRGHIQILATGLGRVTPDWPTGIAGPADNPPKVAATVTALLDRQPVEVTKAVLAPYIGYYLIEIEVPKIVNYGPAELYLQVGGQSSNRVRVYIAP